MAATNQAYAEMKASIIIPVYNAIKFLPATVDSILQQSESDFEVLLIDDYSSDGSSTFCKDIATKDSRFRYFKMSRNSGAAAVRNFGIERARGKYILFVDADDYILPDYVKLLTEIAEKEDVDIVWCNFQYYFLAQESYAPTDHNLRGIIDNEEYMLAFIKNSTGSGSLWNKLFVKQFITQNALSLNEKRIYGEDWDFNFRAAQKKPKVFAIEDVLYTYYKRPTESVSVRYNSSDFDSYRESLLMMIEVLRQLELEDQTSEVEQRFVYDIISLLYKLAHSSLKKAKKKKEFYQIINNDLFKRYLFSNLLSNKHLTLRQKLIGLMIVLNLRGIAWKLLTL